MSTTRSIRCEVGENATGMSQGIWVYIDDVLVWSHVSSEGPLHWQAQSLLNAIWPYKVPMRPDHTTGKYDHLDAGLDERT